VHLTETGIEIEELCILRPESLGMREPDSAAIISCHQFIIGNALMLPSALPSFFEAVNVSCIFSMKCFWHSSIGNGDPSPLSANLRA
jgi:hypothetical protein